MTNNGRQALTILMSVLVISLIVLGLHQIQVPTWGITLLILFWLGWYVHFISGAAMSEAGAAAKYDRGNRVGAALVQWLRFWLLECFHVLGIALILYGAHQGVVWILTTQLREGERAHQFLLFAVWIMAGLLGQQMLRPWIETSQCRLCSQAQNLGSLAQKRHESWVIYTLRYGLFCTLFVAFGVGIGYLVFGILTVLQWSPIHSLWGGILFGAVVTATVHGQDRRWGGQGNLPATGIGGRYVRGLRLIDFDNPMNQHAYMAARQGHVFWGGLYLPPSCATTHFLVCGCAGSGKTMTLKLLMQSVLPAIRQGSDQRALIYDAKRDMVSQLDGMDLPCKYYILNCFDQRAVAWDMAADITSPAAVMALAAILIPENKQANQPFFDNTARALLEGVIKVLIQTQPGNWMFRDVILATDNLETLKSILKLTPETANLVGQYLETETTTQNVFSSLAAYLSPYRIIAALWDRCEEAVSLEAWSRDSFILILGSDDRAKPAMDAINGLIFQRVSELLLSQSESSLRRSWIFLDEAREAGQLKGLNSLCIKGRSKGVCVCLGFQDVEGMRKVYGKEEAHELLGQCANRAFLRAASVESAEFASKLLGQVDLVDKNYSHTHASGTTMVEGKQQSNTNDSSTWNESQQIKNLVMPSQLQGIALPNPQVGLMGYYQTGLLGGICYKKTLSGDFLGKTLRPSNQRVSNFVPREDDEQYLSPWDEEEQKLFRPDLEELAALGAEIMLELNQTSVPVAEPSVNLPVERRPLPKRSAEDLLKRMRSRSNTDKTM